MTGHGDGPQLRPVSPPQPSTVIQTAYAMTNPASASSTQSLIDNLGWRLIGRPIPCTLKLKWPYCPDPR